MQVRLGDVAIRAGVSLATVSRVLNGKPGVSDLTRARVLAEAEQLGYQPPASPNRARTALIGLIVPELENPVFPMYVQAIEGSLVSRGYTPVLCSTTPAVLENEYIDVLLERGVDGLIFVCGRHANTEVDHSRYYELRAKGLPLVCINGWLPDLDAPFLSVDDAAATRMAVEHLADLGHTRIGAVMGPARYITTQRKVAGYQIAVHQRSTYTASDLVVHSVYSVEGGYAAMQVLLDRGVTAVICGSDLMALGAIRAVRGRGLDCPRDVSVIGYDDSPLLTFTDPPLTTVRQDVASMSRQAVEALMDEMSGIAGPRHELLFAAQLVVRASTGPVRAATNANVRHPELQGAQTAGR